MLLAAINVRLGRFENAFRSLGGEGGRRSGESTRRCDAIKRCMCNKQVGELAGNCAVHVTVTRTQELDCATHAEVPWVLPAAVLEARQALD